MKWQRIRNLQPHAFACTSISATKSQTDPERVYEDRFERMYCFVTVSIAGILPNKRDKKRQKPETLVGLADFEQPAVEICPAGVSRNIQAQCRECQRSCFSPGIIATLPLAGHIIVGASIVRPNDVIVLKGIVAWDQVGLRFVIADQKNSIPR